MSAPHISTFWHEQYIYAAQLAYPDECAGHDLAVGWKLTRKDGTTYGGYHWPLVDGDHDLPVLHESWAWDDNNPESCPKVWGDGLCLVTTHASPASSGGIFLGAGVGHVLVFPADLARSDVVGKHRAPWVIDVDCFDPIALLPLSGSDLRGVDLRSSDLRYLDLRSLELRSSDLRSSDLRYSNLRGSDLRYSDLRYSDLRYSDLRYSNLRYSNLRYSDLRYSDLRGSDLCCSNLRGSDLSVARYSAESRFPSGTDLTVMVLA